MGILGERDFHRDPSENLALLAPDAAKRFFAEYETWMLQARPGGRTFRQSLRAEVERLAAAIDDGAPWTPFRLEMAQETKCDT
jgi:hypothetical protein